MRDWVTACVAVAAATLVASALPAATGADVLLLPALGLGVVATVRRCLTAPAPERVTAAEVRACPPTTWVALGVVAVGALALRGFGSWAALALASRAWDEGLVVRLAALGLVGVTVAAAAVSLPSAAREGAALRVARDRALAALEPVPARRLRLRLRPGGWVYGLTGAVLGTIPVGYMGLLIGRCPAFAVRAPDPSQPTVLVDGIAYLWPAGIAALSAVILLRDTWTPWLPYAHLYGMGHPGRALGGMAVAGVAALVDARLGVVVLLVTLAAPLVAVARRAGLGVGRVAVLAAGRLLRATAAVAVIASLIALGLYVTLAPQGALHYAEIPVPSSAVWWSDASSGLLQVLVLGAAAALGFGALPAPHLAVYQLVEELEPAEVAGPLGPTPVAAHPASEAGIRSAGPSVDALRSSGAALPAPHSRVGTGPTLDLDPPTSRREARLELGVILLSTAATLGGGLVAAGIRGPFLALGALLLVATWRLWAQWRYGDSPAPPSRASIALSLVAAAIGALLVSTAPEPFRSLSAAGLGFLVGMAAYMRHGRPSVQISSRGVVVLDPDRPERVGWDQVRSVRRTRGWIPQLRIDFTDGRPALLLNAPQLGMPVAEACDVVREATSRAAPDAR